LYSYDALTLKGGEAMFATAGSTAPLGNRNSAVIYKLENGAERQVQTRTI
jgi:hypothetical protein